MTGLTTQVNGAKKKSAMHLVHYIIMLALIFIIRNATPVAPLTPKGMQLLALLVGCIWGWSFIGLIGPSMIAILVLGFTEGMTVTSSLGATIGNNIVVFMLLVFLIVQMVEDEGLPKLLVDATMKMKIFKGRPALLSAALLVVAAILGIINMFLSIFFMWKIVYELCSRYGYQKHDAYPTIMCIGIVVMATMGLIAFPFQDNGLIIMGAYTGIVGQPMNYFKYLGSMIPLIIGLVAVWTLVSKYVLRVDFSNMKNVDTTNIVVNVTPRQKAAITIVALFVVSLMLQANFKATVIGQVLSSSTVYIVGVAMYIIGSLWVVEGKPMMDFRTLVRGVAWESWWLTAVVMALGSMLTASDTGVSAFCVKLLTPILGGLSPWMFVIVICLAAFVMTNFCNNIVVTICMISILLPMSPVIGFAFEPAVILVILSAHFALFTPAASGPAGLMFSNKEWVALKDVYTKGLILMAFCLLFTLTVGYVWTNLIF